MISIDQRNKLIAALYRHLNIPVIPIDDDGDIPARPYVVYSILNDNNSNGQDVLVHRIEKGSHFVSTSQSVYTEVFYQGYENQKEGTFSFTIHSERRDEAQSVCGDMKEFFERIGGEAIEDAGFAVINVEAAHDRSILIEEHYERRHGFDVRLRYMDRSEYPENSIEEIIFRN